MASIGSLTWQHFQEAGKHLWKQKFNIISGLASGLDTESMIRGNGPGLPAENFRTEQEPHGAPVAAVQAYQSIFQLNWWNSARNYAPLYLQHKPVSAPAFQQCGGDHPKWDVFQSGDCL